MQEKDKTEREKEEQKDQVPEEEGVFSSKEVIIEEMAIDGICGVY